MQEPVELQTPDIAGRVDVGLHHAQFVADVYVLYLRGTDGFQQAELKGYRPDAVPGPGDPIRGIEAPWDREERPAPPFQFVDAGTVRQEGMVLQELPTESGREIGLL